MPIRRFCRPRARRARAEPSAAPTATPRLNLVGHGLAALAVSVLGLGVAGSVSLLSAAQSSELVAKAALVSDRYDVTRAEPAPRTAGLTTRNQQRSTGSRTESDQGTEPSRGDGTLGSFDSADSAPNRNAVQAALDSAVAEQQLAERQQLLNEVDRRVERSSRTAIQARRAQALRAKGEEIEATDAALKEKERQERERQEAAEQEQARAAEASQQAAERATGTLSEPSAKPAPAAEEEDSSNPADAAGGASPIAPGSYSIAARWGAVGSWSRYHTGIDLAAPLGTPIRAAASGVVMPSTGGSWAGTHVIIKHADGSQTLYAHMAGTAVSAGERVQAGTLVGTVGLTGRTFGPHLHFEWYPAGTTPGDVYATKDPYVWMLSQGVRL